MSVERKLSYLLWVLTPLLGVQLRKKGKKGKKTLVELDRAVAS